MKRIPKNRLNQTYWDARDSITDDWIKEQIENDKDFADKLQKIYDEALKLMQDDIYREYSKVSSNLPLAQQKVSQADIEELEKYAEKVVPKRDFSDEANKRMRLYNATMRINRLEMLKSQLGYELINAGLKVDDQLKDHLNDEYQAEIKRQAGIFGATVAPKSLLTNKHVASVVMAGVNGVDFSKRLWTDQDLLKAKLDSILIQVATTGKSNQELARKLVGLVSDAVKKKRYVTERIVRTETARVQAQAQKDMLDEYGFKYCKWHAEPSACRVCRNIAQDDPDGNGFGVYSTDDVPSIPIHANCRCAISAYWVDNKDSRRK